MMYKVSLETFFLIKQSTPALFLYTEDEEELCLYLQAASCCFCSEYEKPKTEEEMTTFLIWKQERLGDAIRVIDVEKENKFTLKVAAE